MELFGITKGILVQQVNCQNQMYAGLAKAIYEQCPKVKEDYTKSFEQQTGKQLFGTYRLIDVDDNLKVANLYTQYDYANPDKPETMGKVYTDRYSLVQTIKELAISNADYTIYIPLNIGCGLGGEVWEDIVEKINELNLSNIKILNTISKTSSTADIARRSAIGAFFSKLVTEKNGQYFNVFACDTDDVLEFNVANEDKSIYVRVLYDQFRDGDIAVMFRYTFSEKNSDIVKKQTQSIIEYKSFILQTLSTLSEFLSEPEISELKLYLLNSQ